MKKIDKRKAASGLIMAVAGVVAVSTIVLGAGPGGGPGGGGGGNMGQVELSKSVISVKLTTPSIGDLSRDTEFIGKIEPAESVNVYPETGGKVTKVYFEAGQQVSKGDLLFEIDDSDAQIDYQLAQASYDQKVISAGTTLGSGYDQKLLSAKSQLDTAQQNLNNARLKLKDYNDGYDDSLLSAEKAEDRAYQKLQEAESALAAFSGDHSSQEYKELYQAVTEANSDYSLAHNAVKDLEDDEDSEARDLRNSYKNFQTSYQQALDNYNLIIGGSLEDTTKSTEAELKSAELSLEQTASKLEKYKVYSPISGTIESRDIDLYENASTNTPAFTISNKHEMSVKFNASADAAVALNTGDTVTLTKSGRNYTALITSIDSKADASTGLFPIEAQIQDDDGALLSGVTVKVTAATQKAEGAILVPIDHVYYDDGQPYVFTYADGKAHRTDFEAGMSNSETVVALSGLTLDSRIITTWHPDLKDGATVELAEGQSDPEPAGASTAESKADGPGGAEPAEAGLTAGQED